MERIVMSHLLSIFIELLLCAIHYSRQWGQVEKKPIKGLALKEFTFWCKETDNQMSKLNNHSCNKNKTGQCYRQLL